MKSKNFLPRLGIMQGRLVPQESKKIQSFPWKKWRREFRLCNKNRFSNIEWTIDNKNFYKNPLNLKDGTKEILKLKKKFNLKIKSLTADFFMQKPFFKEKNHYKSCRELEKIKLILNNSKKIGVKYIVIPLVDNSSLKFLKGLSFFYESLRDFEPTLKKNRQMILFESDFKPTKLKKFIQKFNTKYFGINYDTGNSASLNYNFKSEIKYFKYVKNIHIKDRLKNGSTVRLGKGNYNFELFSKFIKENKYRGNFIFQTARKKNKDILEINLNRNFFLNKLK